MRIPRRQLDDVVDEQDVDAVQPEAVVALLERAQHPIAAVVVDRTQNAVRDALRIEVGLGEELRRGHVPQQPADLGREHELVARPRPQDRPEPALGVAEAIERRRVVAADPESQAVSKTSRQCSGSW